MSAVDETIVREYFESHGFLVCQRRKYIVQSRQKTGDEEVDLIVLNPRATAAIAEIATIQRTHECKNNTTGYILDSSFII